MFQVYILNTHCNHAVYAFVYINYICISHMDDVWFYLPFPLKEQRTSNLNIMFFCFCPLGCMPKRFHRKQEGDRM